MHGHAEPKTVELSVDGRVEHVERGGVALLAGYVEAARRRNPGRVILVDGGDMMQGTLVSNLGEGAVMIRAMNALGYAAAAVGNHEFDYGPVGDKTLAGPGDDPRGALEARAAEAKFPLLTSNIVEKDGRPPGGPHAARFTLLTVDGVRVGIVGGTTEDTPRATAGANLVGLRFLPLAPSVAAAAREARAAGATVVVAVVHAGGECERFATLRGPAGPMPVDEVARAELPAAGQPVDAAALGCKPDDEVMQLAHALASAPGGSPVDAIFGGHTHRGVAVVVDGIPVAQAWSQARSLARIDLAVDRATGRVVPGGYTVYPPRELCAAGRDGGVEICRAGKARRIVPATYDGEPVVADDKVRQLIALDVARADATMRAPVGVRVDARFWGSYHDESPLGNLLADLERDATHADVGIINGGTLRADFPVGELSYGALYETIPFDNRLVVVPMTGAMLRRWVARNAGGDRGILSLSGVRAVLHCSKGKLGVDLVRDDGKPLPDDATVRIAMSDFLANGGDDVGALGLARHGDDAAPSLRDALRDALRTRGGTLDPRDRHVYDPAHPRLALPGPRPVRCGAGP